MKSLYVMLFIIMLFVGVPPLSSEDSYFNADLAKVGQCDSEDVNQSRETARDVIKRIFSIDASVNYLAGKAAHVPVITNVFYYQYTLDGSAKQHVAVYGDCVICTNISGPREGVQFIIANNGAIIDMCHYYSIEKNYSKHKYSWGEVLTYQDHQIVVYY